MSNHSYNQGAHDKQQGLGPRNDFSSWQARESYNAGYKKG